MTDKGNKSSPPKLESLPSKGRYENGQIQRSMSSVSIPNILNPWRNRMGSLENTEIANIITEPNENINSTDNPNEQQAIPSSVTDDSKDNDVQESKAVSTGETNITLEEYREEIRRQSSEQSSTTAGEQPTKQGFPWPIWGNTNRSSISDDTVPESSTSISKGGSTTPLLNAEVGIQPPTNDAMQWINWINPVDRIGSVVSLVYNPNTLSSKDVNHLGFTPNEISEVVNSSTTQRRNTTHSLHRTASNRSSLHADTNQQSTIWWPWTWGSNKEPSNQSLTVEVSVKLTRDTIAAVQSQGASNLKTSSWGYWHSHSPNLDETEIVEGELAVDGTESASNPANVGQLPRSQFETVETLIKAPISTVNGLPEGNHFTLPVLDANYRDETIKTNTRIALSNIIPIIFKRQSHLYHKKNYTLSSSLTTEQTASPNVYSGDNKGKPSKSKWPKKKAVVIGVHGFLPLKMVRSLIGQSTGTAEKYALEAKNALSKWALLNKIEVQIETISLEGEGKILERTSDLFRLLDNWMSSITSCDYLIFASHSQSVPISIHLAAKLVVLGYLDKVPKIGMINMAGLCLGPIPGLDAKLSVKSYTKFENEILMELFDLQNPETLQSQELIRSLRILVKRNVKLTFVGSLNDQLIPLYSAVCCQVDHPNIFRALHVDEESSQFPFLYKLVSYILYLKNLGLDHDRFLVEISRYLYGTVGDGGHSSLFDDETVYSLGIKNTLETSDMFYSVPLKEKKIDSKNLKTNKYHLPWCLRGFLEEFSKLPNIDSKKLISQLIKDFQSWTPDSKLHKDFKYSIEVMGDLKLDDLCN